MALFLAWASGEGLLHGLGEDERARMAKAFAAGVLAGRRIEEAAR